MSETTTASCPSRLKRSLAATRVEEDGIVYFDVIEPATSREFRFYEHEYQLAQQLEPGRPLADLAAWVQRELGVASHVADLQVFIQHVADLGFLEEPAAAPAPRRDEKQQAAAFAAALTSAGERADVLSVPFAASGAGLDSPRPAGLPTTPRSIPLDALPGARAAARPASPESGAPAPGAPAPALGAPAPGAPAPALDARAPGAPAPALDARAPGAPAPALDARAPAARPAAVAPALDARAPAARPAAVAPALAEPRRKPARKGISLVWLLVPLLLLGVAVALFVVLQRPRTEAAAITLVKVLDVRLQHVTRFHSEARLTAPEPQLLSFTEGGPLVVIAAAGKRVEPGEVLAKLEGADRVQRELAHAREREAHYRLRLEAAQEGTDKGTLRQIERKVEEKQKLVAERGARYAARVVVSPAAGIVVAASAKAGETVKPGQAVVRFVPLKLRADFELDAAVGAAMRPAQVVRLVTAAGREQESHVELGEPHGARVRVRVALDPAAGVKEGETVRLVRARFEQVAQVPLTAVARRPQGDVVFVLEGDAVRARPVTVVDRDERDALLARGVRAGDRLVAVGVETLADGTRVRAAQ